jgi:HSP20 family protein
MTLMRREPFLGLANIEGLFDDVRWGLTSNRNETANGSYGSWIPAVDIYEDGEKGLIIKAELPGLNRDDIKVMVEDNKLSISGERKLESDMSDDKVHRLERSYGAFQRSFRLPTTVESSQVHADYADGTLTVALPLREDAKPKQIPIGNAS